VIARLFAAASLTLACGLSACAGLAPGACPAGSHGTQTAQLFFGRDVGDRLGVSDDDFARFLDEEVTPRFPDGLTVLDARGQWRGPQGLVREPSKVVEVVLAGKPDDRARLSQAADAYKRRFHQQSVLILTQPACAAF
jgi:hypothetical protein